MADKFVQIRDGAANNIYPNLNLSPFHSQFFTTSTVGGRARITLAESAYRVAPTVDPYDSSEKEQDLVGRVAITNPATNILSNLTSRLANGQDLPDDYLWLSANTWIVPSLREIASAFAFYAPASCTSAAYATSAQITSLVTSEAISSSLRAIPTVATGRVLKATANGLEWSSDLKGLTAVAWGDVTGKPSVYGSATHATTADTADYATNAGSAGEAGTAAKLGTKTEGQLLVSSAAVAGNAAKLGGLTSNQLLVSSAVSAGNAAKLGGKTANQLLVSSAAVAGNAGTVGGHAAAKFLSAFGAVTQTGTSLVFTKLDGTTKVSQEISSALYATQAQFAQSCTSATYATSAQITSLVTKEAISSALRSNVTGVANGKVLQATANGLQWATVTGGGGGDSTITVLKGLSNFANGGYVLKTNGTDISWGVDSVGQGGGGGGTATVSLAQYAGSGSTCTTSDAGRVGTLCYQNLAALYNMCVNGSAGSMTYTGWDNSYTVPSAGAIAQLLADVVQNILRNGSSWSGTVSVNTTTT